VFSGASLPRPQGSVRTSVAIQAGYQLGTPGETATDAQSESRRLVVGLRRGWRWSDDECSGRVFLVRRRGDACEPVEI
jgi:hypothetical protein